MKRLQVTGVDVAVAVAVIVDVFLLVQILHCRVATASHVDYDVTSAGNNVGSRYADDQDDRSQGADASTDADSHVARSRRLPREEVGPSPCDPVPYEVLWRRLELETSPLHRRRLSLVDPTSLTPLSNDDDDGNNENILPRSVSRRRKRRSERVVSMRLTGGNVTTGINGTDDDVIARGQNSTTTQSQRQRQQRQRHRLRSLDQLSRYASESRRSRAAPWLCRLVTRWKRMPDDVFPPFIETGSCVGSGSRSPAAPSTCMGGLFECVPRRYTIKVLRRVTTDVLSNCYPVPLIGRNATHYEDVWMTAEHHVTVNCECSKRREFGHYAAPRSPGKQRGPSKLIAAADDHVTQNAETI